MVGIPVVHCYFIVVSLEGYGRRWRFRGDAISVWNGAWDKLCQSRVGRMSNMKLFRLTDGSRMPISKLELTIRNLDDPERAKPLIGKSFEGN